MQATSTALAALMAGHPAKAKAAVPAAYVSDAYLALHFGIRRETIWAWVRRGDFPKPVKLSPQMTRWRWADVQAWEAAKAEAA